MAAKTEDDRPPVAVFAPSPVLTIIVEVSPSSEDEIHLHAGGQDFWVARMAAVEAGGLDRMGLDRPGWG